MIIVAGYEASASGSGSPSVWAHAAGIDSVSVDGKTIYEYAMFGEKQWDHLATFGVIAHELGHLMFSLPDLYDTDTSNGDSAGIGYFCLMAGGSWGAASGANGGSSPTHLCAWSKEYLSWGTTSTITSNQTVSFPKADGNSASIFRMNTSDSNEYFLIENRQFTGYDIGFQGSTGSSGHGGLVIYHIDKLKTNLWPNTSNEVNADENDKGVDVEEANEGSLGYSMLDTKEYSAHTNMFYFSGNNTSFTDTTMPNSRLKNGNSTSISITDISAYGDTMTATVPARPPIARTGSATDLTSNSATLNGTVNALGISTTVWFEYGTTSGSYTNTSSSQSVSGENDITVSIGISELSSETPSGTFYYYRIVAQNSTGTTYGSENTFILITVTPKIAAGNTHTTALKSGGTVLAWGDNGSGRLGDGTTTDSAVPVQVDGINSVTSIGCGDYHTISLKSDGTVWAWGDNYYGQLGDRTLTDRSTPVQVSELSDVIAIAGGAYHSIALKSDGTVWVWGDNGSGQLGDGTTTDRRTPVQVSGLSDVTAVAGGVYHTIALKSDGTVWTWGANWDGQLGDGTYADRSTPIQVSGLRDVIAIACGGYHSMALKSDGTVWIWGDNWYGQLGDGTWTDRSTPIQVSGLSAVVAIAGGRYHSMALKSSGIVWTWGDNGSGQLGDGSTTTRTTPVQVSDLNGVIAIAGGGYHSIAIKSDGTLWAWGYNVNGQLGDGTTTDRMVPVQVNNIDLGDEFTDSVAPEGSININSDAPYTNSVSVTLNFSAMDAFGVVGYYISTNPDTPSISDSNWTSVSSVTIYTGTVSYTLSDEDATKTLYVWYKDAAGNISSMASDSIILDTTIPTITITSPTSNGIYTTSSNIISLSGSAFDNGSGISDVTWSNNKGGSGFVIGTTSWFVPEIILSVGENVITVTATDGAGNTGFDTIIVNYSGVVSTPTPQPTQEPKEKGNIYGDVVDTEGNSVKLVKIKLKSTKTNILRKTTSDENGIFEFTDLDADTYIVYAKKRGYKKAMQKIVLGKGESEELEIIMRKTSKRVKELMEESQ